MIDPIEILCRMLSMRQMGVLQSDMREVLAAAGLQIVPIVKRDQMAQEEYDRMSRTIDIYGSVRGYNVRDLSHDLTDPEP